MVTIPRKWKWNPSCQNTASRRSPAGKILRFLWWKLRFYIAIFEVFRTLYQQLIAHTPNTSKYSKKLIFSKYFKISSISPNTSKSQDWTMDHGGRGGGSCFTLSEVFDPYDFTTKMQHFPWSLRKYIVLWAFWFGMWSSWLEIHIQMKLCSNALRNFQESVQSLYYCQKNVPDAIIM